MTGKAIFLNGTSSAGKTTLARALQEKLEEPWQHVALDQFRDGLPDKYRGLNAPQGSTGDRGLNVVPVTPEGREAYTAVCFGEDGRQLLRGMRRAMAAMTREGVNILVDDILLDPEFLEDYLAAMYGIDVYLVAVRCPPDIIAIRETMRPGRFPGTAIGHFETCHSHGVYDVEVDTSVDPPEDCADQVIARLNEGGPTAFKILRAR